MNNRIARPFLTLLSSFTLAHSSPTRTNAFQATFTLFPAKSNPELSQHSQTNFISTTTRPTLNSFTSTAINMGWSDTWNDIAEGGPQRWKVTDSKSHEAALSHMERYLPKDSDGNIISSNILCPLAGDDPMVHLLWDRGHSVTAIDLVPLALERMRKSFDGAWTQEESNGMVVWKHESGRATQYEGDVMKSLPELLGTMDAVYDKDSFGALSIEGRQPYCARIAEYTKKENAFVYLECKLSDNHNDVTKLNGPPYSLKKEDLMDPRWYGGSFDHVESLGSVYPVSMPGSMQSGHVFRRRA